MKRFYLALLAVATLLSACDKENSKGDDPTPGPDPVNSNYHFNIEKDGIKDNDQVRVFFSGLTDGYLELTYTSNSWEVKEHNISISKVAGLSTKKCAAVLIDGNAEPEYSSDAWQFAQGGEMFLATGVDYTVDGDKINATLSLKQHEEFAKVIVPGISGSNWTLLPREDWGIAAKAGKIALAADCASTTVNSSLEPYKGVACSEGVYFFVAPESVERTTLKIDDGTVKYISTSGSNLSESKGKAIKVKGLTAADSNWLETSDVLYVTGSASNLVDDINLPDWDTVFPMEIPLVDGKYTFVLSHFSSFGMSTKKCGIGDEVSWNKNYVGIPSDLKAGVPAITLKSWAANAKNYSSVAETAANRIVWDGTFIVEVTENFDYVSMQPKYIYVAGKSTTKLNGVNLPDWKIDNPPAIEIADGKFQFTIETVNDNDNIDIGSTNPIGNWGSWNVCKFSPSPKYFDAGTLNLVVNKDGWFFNKAGKYNVVINNTLTAAEVTKL